MGLRLRGPRITAYRKPGAGAWTRSDRRTAISAGGYLTFTLGDTTARGGAFGGGTVTGAAVPSAPTLSVTAGDAQNALSWNAPANGGSAITNYKVFRGTSAGGETLLTTLGNVTSFTDTGAVNGTRYYYKVAAVNSVGDGAQSNEVNAMPSPSISIADVSRAEGNSGQADLTFTATLTNPSSQPVTVAYATQDGTATTAGSDYAAATGTLTFDPGATTESVAVKVNGDNTFEPNEGFTINLSSPTNASITDAIGAGTITNDDAQPTISIADVTASEGNSGTTNFVFTLSLSNPSYQTITVNRQTQDGTATSADSDYGALAPAPRSFAPGDTTTTTTIGAFGDSKFEPDENFLVKLSGATNATIADDTGVGTIQNDDAVPQAIVNDVTHLEGNSSTTAYTFTVALSNPSYQSVMVDYATQDGAATVAGSDYAAASGTLTFTTGQTAKTVTVNANGDTLFEPDEDFRLRLPSSTNATIADDTGVGTIQNDDAQPALSVSDVATAEGNLGTANLAFTVSLGSASGQPVSVAYATQDGSATTTSGDYAATSGNLTFTPGQVSKTVNVPMNGDITFEPDETLALNLSGASGATVSDGTGQGTIQNDDPLPQISVDDVSHLEGNSAQTAYTFTVSLSNPSYQAIGVTAHTEDGTATTADSDYAAIASQAVSFAPGETQKQVTVNANGDTKFEADETFALKLAGPSNATIADDTGTGTVRDDDGQPQLVVNDVSAFEGNAGATNLTFTVSLNHASDQSIGVGYATQDGTAKTADSDYSAVSGTLTFSAGETAKTVTVHANGDTLSEADETFTLGLSGATGATIADASGTGTIRDDDPLPQISVNDVSHAEGNTGQVDHTFTVSLSTVSGQPVGAAYATQNGTATIADSDYAQASGTVTVPTGQTSATVTVKANGDTTFEPDESFALKLSAPSAATISDDTGAGTIQNDDPQPQIAVTDVSHAEGASGQTDFDFTVSLANPSSETVSVDYATQEGSATTADSDYAAASGSLSFDPGQTSKTVTVKANGDAKHEPDESFSLRLSNPVHATISDDTGAGTIQNDDGQPQISIADVSKLEGNTGTTDFAFAVSLSNPTTDTVTVDIASADGSATVADGDYQALAPLTLTFSPGTTQVSASVTANADTSFESDETFTAELSNPGNATIGDTTGVGTIQNDDTQPQISVNDVGVLEGNSGQTDMTFTVSLSNPSAQAVSVGYATADGTATAGSDYVAASGTVSFDPGQTSKSVVVEATGDTQVENNETFTLNLSGPTGATIADGSGLGSIQNDDSKYPRPKAATPISVALVQAYDDCTSPNSTHDGTILPAGTCAPPVKTSTNLTSGTPDANGATANFVGSVLLRACMAPACAGADVAIDADLTDVRCEPSLPGVPPCAVPNTAAGADYGGELRLDMSLRMTDRANVADGGGAPDQGTVQDFSIPATIPCQATLDTNIGGHCSLSTTANTLVPGAVTGGGRAIWELGQVKVYDAGPDGAVSTPDGSAPFAAQGVFVP